jgi:hypothetical protein
MRFKVKAAIRSALLGVGVPETDTPETGYVSAIVRRRATDGERQRVTENYLQGEECWR